MSWTDLLDATAARAGLPPAQTRRGLEALREEVTLAQARGEAVTLFGLGTSRPRTLAPPALPDEDEAVHAACQDAFGRPRSLVEENDRREISISVRLVRDHLAEAAPARWA